MSKTARTPYKTKKDKKRKDVQALRGVTRSPATAGTANRSLLFLEHRIPMPELFTELRFSILPEFWMQEIRLPLLGGDAPRLG